MPDAVLDDRDYLTRFATHHRDLFNKEILSKMKTPLRACPCGRPDEVPSCRIHDAVLRCLNRTFRKLLPPFKEVMEKKNELRERDRRTGRPGVLKSELQLCVCAYAVPKFMGNTMLPRTQRSIRLYADVKETLDDMAAGCGKIKYQCEVCGKIICVFCGVACAHCNDLRTCRECAKTYENFTYCNSCDRAYCNDNEVDNCDFEKVIYCSRCDKFCCWDTCENTPMMFCTICTSDPICIDCAFDSADHIECDKCLDHFMCAHHNDAEEHLTYVYSDDEYSGPEKYVWLCNSCLNPSPPKPPIEKRPQPQQKAPIEKPRSPSVSPRMSLSSSKDDTD
jgi:hypothetical protein